MDNLLLDERPLLVMPKLATLIGLNESIVLQQVHYWLKGKEQRQQNYIDGRYWVYNTYEQWQEQFPFWSIRTLKRIFTALENSGLLRSANHNRTGFDKTKWYSIDYDALNALSSPCQNGTTIVPTCHYGVCQNDPTNTIDYTETTTKRIKGCGTETVPHSNRHTVQSVHTGKADYEIMQGSWCAGLPSFYRHHRLLLQRIPKDIRKGTSPAVC